MYSEFNGREATLPADTLTPSGGFPSARRLWRLSSDAPLPLVGTDPLPQGMSVLIARIKRLPVDRWVQTDSTLCCLTTKSKEVQ